MSDYVYESGLSTKRRRQRRTAITLLLTVLLLFSAFWWAWSYIRSGGDGATAVAEPTSTATATTCSGAADPRDVTINVYNATQVTGLAGRVANELKSRGYTIGTVSNDPLQATVEAPAALRYGDAGRPYAAILKTIVDEPALHPDGRPDTAVDFVLGDGFTELNPQPAGIPTC